MGKLIGQRSTLNTLHIRGGLQGTLEFHESHVGVIWFGFPALQLVLIRFLHNKIMLHQQIYDEKINLKIKPSFDKSKPE